MGPASFPSMGFPSRPPSLYFSLSLSFSGSLVRINIFKNTKVDERSGGGENCDAILVIKRERIDFISKRKKFFFGLEESGESENRGSVIER